MGVLAGLSGCGDDDAGVGLAVTVKSEPGTLRIDYTVTNRSDKPMIVFDGVPERDTHERPSIDPSAAYVVQRGDGSVEVAKRIFGPPGGSAPVEFVLRGATLAPGESFGEVVRLSLPLKARHPYDTAATLTEPVSKVTFCLGVAPDGAVAPVPVPSGDGDTRPIYPHRAAAESVQQLICSAPTSI